MLENITRRTMLSGTAAASTLAMAACARMSMPVTEIPDYMPPLLVDAHCHVFNTSDLPVQGFVWRVFLEDYEHDINFPTEDSLTATGLIESFGAFLVALLSAGSITADREREEIENGLPFAKSEWDDRFDRALERTLQRTVDPSGSAATRALEATTLTEQILEESGQDFRNFDSAEAARRLSLSEGFIGRHIRWARWMTGSRWNLVEELIRIHGGPSRVAMLTPSMIDYSAWLEDDPRSNLASQIAVMDVIQQRTSVPVHSLVAYDPWRHIRDEAVGEKDSALEMVKFAIEDCGFLGVKVYPPMGFLPWGNDSQEYKYPERAMREFGSSFTRKLNDALRRLYAWCETNCVPIMTHATHSQGANEGYAARANPQNWELVLKHHRNLRINLGHFGHFDDKLPNSKTRTWEAAVEDLVNRRQSGSDEAEYPNVYADISYINEVLPCQTGRRRVRKGFRDLSQIMPQRLLYGTDWIMIGQEPYAHTYPYAMAELLADAGLQDQINNIYLTNALRFYGFTPDSRAIERLKRYYTNYTMDFSRISRLLLNE